MTVVYFPIHEIRRSECQKLAQEYFVTKKIGEGASGKVFEVCKNNDCQYVLKVIEYDDNKWKQIGAPKQSFEHIRDSWYREIKIHQTLMECQAASSFKFIPTIYDWWHCDYLAENPSSTNHNVYFFIVMEKYDGNLTDFVKLFAGPQVVDNQFIQWLIKKELLGAIGDLKHALGIIHHNCHICLRDIKPENILYKADYESQKFHFAYADFGLTEKHMTILDKKQIQECMRRDNEALERSIDAFMNNFPYLLQSK